MIRTILKFIFTVRYQYTNPIHQQRARTLLVICAIIAVAALLSLVTIQIPDVLREGVTDPIGLASSVVVALAGALGYILIQRGYLIPATWIFLLALTFGSLSPILFGPNGAPTLNGTSLVFVPVPLVAAGVLVRRRGLVFITALVFLAIAAGALSQSGQRDVIRIIPAEHLDSDLVLVSTTVITILVFVVAFAGNLERIANQSMMVAREQRWINRFILDLGRYQNENALLNYLIITLRQHFSRWTIELYLTDENNNLVQIIRGVSDDVTIRHGAVLRPYEANSLAEAARTGHMTSTSLSDDLPRRSHLSASAAYGVALPILLESRLLGVLDIQSKESFTTAELEILSLLSQLLGLTLQQLRQLNGLQSTIQTSDAIIAQLEGQLQEYELRQRRSVTDVWGSYVQGRGKEAIGFDLVSGSATPVPADDLPENIVATLSSGALNVSTTDTEQIINVPIKFRDYNLGAMSFAVPANQPLNKRQIEVAQVVAERLALALENTRLFEQSQAQALRERKASEIAALLMSATDVNVVLNVAAENFKEALGAVHTRIYIQPEMMNEPVVGLQKEAAR
ncbi:MAG: hypothetical protein JNJ78_14725 [Anaerolineae bacterium]|nr:hypothetical protein [Anaerolineae bacterium]